MAALLALTPAVAGMTLRKQAAQHTTIACNDHGGTLTAILCGRRILVQATLTAKMRLLYVEDHPDVRELIGLLLEEEGLSVVACASAESAEVEFAQAEFDILMTDLSLPSMPGTELATRLQQHRPELWVVFCSGYPMQHGLKLWGPRARCLMKPFEAEELHALMQEIRASSAAPDRPASQP